MSTVGGGLGGSGGAWDEFNFHEEEPEDPNSTAGSKKGEAAHETLAQEKYAKLKSLTDKIYTPKVNQSSGEAALKGRAHSNITNSPLLASLTKRALTGRGDRSGTADTLPKTPLGSCVRSNSLRVSDASQIRLSIDAFSENKEVIKQDITDLKAEMNAIFSKEDGAFLNEISPKLDALEEHFKQLENATDDEFAFENIEDAVLSLSEQIKDDINLYIDSKTPRDIEQESKAILSQTEKALQTLDEVKFNLLNPSKAVTELKTLKNQLASEKINDTVVRITEQFSKLETAMKELQKSKESHASHPEFAREIFKNATVLKDRSHDIFLIAKQQLLKKAEVESPEKLKNSEKAHYENILNKHTITVSFANDYFDKLKFTDLQKSEFKDLSILSHIPRREHLLLPIRDMIQGAQDLVNGYEAKLQEKIDKKELTTLEVISEREKISVMRQALTELDIRAVEHPKLGNSNLLEQLSLTPKEWKAQQKEAKEAMQNEIINPLIKAYCKMVSPYESEASLKQAGKAITAARDARINDTAKWGTPIQRSFDIPGGPLYGKDITVDHTLRCLNQGYASSSFRGRERGFIQPNLQEVYVGGINYSSSATNVEFFQLDENLRREGTLNQTAEILSKKIENKLLSLEPHENNGQSINKPLQVDVSTTLLLSPDKTRDMLAKNSPVLNFLVTKLTGHGIDASGNEREILRDSVAAWLAFDKTAGNESPIGEIKPLSIEGQKEFKFKSADGTLDLSIKALKNEKNENVFEFNDGKGNKTYVQFNVSCYNVGVNKMSAIFAKGAKLQEIGGHALSDQLNERAFKKDFEKGAKKLTDLTNLISLKFPEVNRKDQKEALGNILKMIGNEKTDKFPSTGLRDLRSKLELAEENYQKGLSGKQSKDKLSSLENLRNKAFDDWKGTRDEIAKALFKELKPLQEKASLTQVEQSYKEVLEAIQKREDILDCIDDVKIQLTFKTFRSEEAMKTQMYTLSASLVALGIELGEDPHTGCRSGKDRTSIQRIEVGTRALLKNIYGRHLGFREIEKAPETKKIREALVLHSGHHDELAKLNIGGVGLNLGGAFGNYLKDIDEEGNIYNSWFEEIVLGGVNKMFERNLKDLPNEKT